jgi:hypothetical protein
MRKKIASFLDKSMERSLGIFERFAFLLMLISAVLSLALSFISSLDELSLLLVLMGPIGAMGFLLMFPIFALPVLIWLDPALYQRRLKENPPPVGKKTSPLKELGGGVVISLIMGAIVTAIVVVIYCLTGISLSFVQEFAIMFLIISVLAAASQVSPNIKRFNLKNRILSKIRGIKNRLSIRMNHKYSSF